MLVARAWGARGQGIAARIENLAAPVVAAVNGYALGGGCEIALACDIRICSEKARFGQPEVTLGIPPGWGGTQRLARATNIGFAKEMVLTGRMVGAEEALRAGLVNHVHPPDELLDKALGLAEAGRLGADADVARERDLAAAAEGVAVDGRDDGGRHVLDAGGETLPPLRPCAGLPRVGGPHGGDVGPGAERLLAGAGQHDGADRLVGVDLVEARVERVEHLGRHRVEGVGAVQGDQCDVVAALQFD